jgi:DNA-binding CsgD family transcriptional regulator
MMNTDIRKLSAERRTVLIYVFMFAYILSFIFSGSVFSGILENLHYTVSDFSLIIILFHCTGTLIASFLVKQKNASKALKSCLAVCMVLTPFFCIDSKTAGLTVMTVTAAASGIALASWGAYFKCCIARERRIRCMADALIFSNVLMIFTTVISTFVSSYAAMALVIGYLIIAIMIAYTGEEISLEEKWPAENLRKPIACLLVFVFVITIDSGFMYSIVNPSFSAYPQLVSWYWALPYILFLALMKYLPGGRTGTRYIYLALGMIAAGFVLYRILNISSVSYIIIDTCLLGAAGILDLFWSSTVGECLSFTANGVKLFGIGLAANSFGVASGSALSSLILQYSLNKADLALIALTIVCISMIAVPYLIEQLKAVLRNNMYINTYKTMEEKTEKIFAPAEPDEPLTGREKEVLHLVLEGLSNDEIAAKLVISKNTVRTHMRSILAKYDVSNRTELISLVLKSVIK